jgi:hypothetical protein
MAYPAQKVAAVMFDLCAGMGMAKTAEKHGIAKTTLIKWTKKLPIKKQVQYTSLDRLSDLLEELLVTELRTLSLIAAHAQDKEWLGKQSADDLGVFYGIVADKAHLQLAAIDRAQRQAQAQIEAGQQNG